MANKVIRYQTSSTGGAFTNFIDTAANIDTDWTALTPSAPTVNGVTVSYAERYDTHFVTDSFTSVTKVYGTPDATFGSQSSGAVIVSQDPGSRAVNTLRVAAAVKNAETVTVGTDVYEIVTTNGAAVGTPGHVKIDLSPGAGSAAVAAAGTLTSANTGAFTAAKKVTIGTKVYTFRASITGSSVDGDVLAGADGDAGLTNLKKAINLESGAGTNYATAMTAGPATSGAVTSHTLVITANIPGTGGNALTFSTDEAKLSVDAATLGTTTAGVDPTADDFTDLAPAAINAYASAYSVEDIGNNELYFSWKTVGSSTEAVSETLSGASNVWASANFYGGRNASAKRIATQSRIPNATEVALGNMHFGFDFAPKFVNVYAITTATGINKGWVGAWTITATDPNSIIVDNSGATDWAATDTVYVEVTD